MPWRGTELVWHPVRSALGTRIVGMGGYTAERVGQVVIEGHTESEDGLGHEEVYVVLRGRATFTLDDTEVDAPAGTFVVVDDPSVYRRAVAAEAGTAVLALGGPPVFSAVGLRVDRARAPVPALRSGARDPRSSRSLRTAKPDGPGGRGRRGVPRPRARRRPRGARHARAAARAAARPPRRCSPTTRDLEPLLDT